MSAWSSAGRWPLGQFGSPSSSGRQFSRGIWIDLRYSMSDWICWAFIGPPPSRPHADIGEPGRPYVEDVADLGLVEPVEHRVQRRRQPVDRPDLLGHLVGDGVRRDTAAGRHAAVATGAVEAAVGRRREETLTPAGEPLLEALGGARLAARLEHPVQGQADDDDDEQQHAVQLDPLQPLALEDLVVVVRLAVGGQLDLRADLLARRAGVEEGVDDPSDDDDRQDDPRDRRRGKREHQWPPPPVMQCGPSAS